MSDFIFLGSKITVDGDWSHKIKRCLLLGRKAITNLRQCIKKQRYHFADKGPYSQSYHFSSSHVWMWELEEGWVLKNWCFQTVGLENTLEGPLGIREIKPVNPKGNQPWIFIGRTNAEAETPILWPPDAKSWKILMLGKIEGRRRRGQQRMKWLDGVTDSMDMSLSKLREVEAQGNLACCSSWHHRELDMTQWPNNNNDLILTNHTYKDRISKSGPTMRYCRLGFQHVDLGET